MSTLILNPTRDEQDGWVSPFNTNFTQVDSLCRMDSNAMGQSRANSWFTYEGCVIDQGATINSAIWSFIPNHADSYVDIFFHNHDNSPICTTGDNPATRLGDAQTTATVRLQRSHDIGSTDTEDVTAIVQEVIDRPGWAAENICLMGYGDISPNVWFRVDSVWRDVMSHTLEIDYEGGEEPVAGGIYQPAVAADRGGVVRR